MCVMVDLESCVAVSAVGLIALRPGDPELVNCLDIVEVRVNHAGTAAQGVPMDVGGGSPS